MSIKNIFIIKLLLFLSTNILNANISGIVFQDLPVNNQILNTYGTKDSNELGVEGILVTAYPDNKFTLTDSNGNWALNTTQDSRIEFSNIPSYLKESVKGSSTNISVQFIQDNTTTVKFALHNPADFSETVNPLYVSNLQQNGTHDNSIIQNLQTVHYNASELNADFSTHANIQGTGEIPQDTILMDKLGSVWGKAYQKNKKRLFTSSMLQRHIGFANTPANIYVTDYSASTPAILLGNFSLQGKAPSNGGINIDLGTVDRSSASGSDYTLTLDPLLQNIDIDAYAKVGKISYGGIDIDHNTNTLWALNLNQKGIISIDISGNFNSLHTSTTNQYLISQLNNKPICSNGELRPWALKVHKNKGYIGAICDASISSAKNDLSAHVFSFHLNNPLLGFTKELDFQLNYNRQLRNWYAWENNYFNPTHPKAYDGVIYGQPILSDIEFDKSDNMYIAFFDRYSTQLGTGNYRAILGTSSTEGSYEYGEILKICNTNGVYQKEGTGNCLQSNYTQLAISEFFNDQGGDRNYEASLGALAILKGSNQLLLTTIDPHPESTTNTNISDYWFTQGTHTLSTIDGSINNWYSFALTSIQGLNSKANGLGDIELITEAAPIEIGDRVWLDSNSNGIQDANELGIKDVNLTLVCNSTTVATAITDNLGNYIFSNDPHGTSTASHIYNISSLIENNNQCYINLPNIIGNNKQSVLNSKVLTQNHIGEGLNTSLNDSNGIIDNNNSKLIVLSSDIPISGHNNHSFDIGFKPIVNPNPPVVNPNPPVVNPNPPVVNPNPPVVNPLTVQIGNRVWIENDNDGDANTGTITPIVGQLVVAISSDGTSYSAITDNNGIYLITVPQNDTYIVSLSIPDNHVSTSNLSNNDIHENILENNLAHNPNGTTVIITTTDNLTVDFGFRLTAVFGTTICQELKVNDDIVPANELNATTTINVLANDIGSKPGQKIKFLSLEKGKSLWESDTQNIDPATLSDTLIVEGEGTWKVVNEQVVFTALNSFDGQVPTPIYYLIQGTDCTVDTQFSNVAQVSINTPCYCPIYSTKSVNSLNTLSMILLIFLTIGFIILNFKKELQL